MGKRKAGTLGRSPRTVHPTPPPAQPCRSAATAPRRPARQPPTPHFCLCALPQPPARCDCDTSTPLPAPRQDTQAAGGGGGCPDVLQGPVGTSRGCAYSFLLFPRGPWPPWVTKRAPLPASCSPPPHCPVHKVPGNPGNQWLLYSLEGRHFTLGENPSGGREQPLLCSDPSVAHCSS